MTCRACGCSGHGQTWEVTCSVCREPRWPAAATRPDPYVCVRCRSGAGQARRLATGKGGRATQAAKLLRSSHNPIPSPSQPARLRPEDG